MMKVSAKELPSFVEMPPASIRVVLVYGEDSGQVKELVKAIANSVIENVDDPFSLKNITIGSGDENSTSLYDEVVSQSFGFGKTVVSASIGSENISDELRAILEGPAPPSLLVLGGEYLPPRSPVRKILEKSPLAAVIPCYQDSERSLLGLIRATAREENVEISKAAEEYLVSRLGADRLVTRQELEKLMLFSRKTKSLSIDGARRLLEDSGVMSVEELVYAVTDGSYKKITLYADRAAEEGVSSIAILRATQRHLYRLYQVSQAVQSGKSISDAMNNLQPPVFFALKRRFQKQIEIWTPSLLQKALDLMLKTEITCKTGQIPERAVFERSLFRTAQLPKKS